MDKNLRVKIEFGTLLKQLVKEKCLREKIGGWAFWYYSNNIKKLDNVFEDTLITLHTMEMGPEFYYSYEELHKIADDLIAGKEVKL